VARGQGPGASARLAALAVLMGSASAQSVITNPGPGNPTTYLAPGPTFTLNAAAVIDGTGKIGAAQGSPTNCVTVNGGSAQCGFVGTLLPSQILGGGASVGQVLGWNGLNYVPTNQAAASGSTSVYLNSSLVGTRSQLNFLTGGGALLALSDTGTQINVQVSADTTYVAAVATVQGGALSYVPSASGSGTTYTACPASVVNTLTMGMVLNWVPDVNSVGGATTLNLCTLGPTALKLANGTSNPSSISVVAGRMYTVWFDGTVFRLKDVTS